METGGQVGSDLTAAFTAAAEAAGARVARSSQAGLADALAGLLESDGVAVADAGLGEIAARLQDRGAGVVPEGQEPEFSAALSAADAGLCSALAGVAESGTVVIGPGAGYEGFVSLLPPHCIVVLPVGLIRPDLASTLSEIAPLLAGKGSRFVFVTGPSRTSDIELTSVVGVHGPLHLDVVIVDV